jgi:hypothetical protein
MSVSFIIDRLSQDAGCNLTAEWMALRHPSPRFLEFHHGAPTMLQSVRFSRCAAYAAMPVSLLLALSAGSVAAALIDIHGPPGSGQFGYSHAILPNGNIVITDPGFSLGSIPYVGAVYLYRPDGTLISSMTGSQERDLVGLNGIVVLSNGNFLVSSTVWNNGDAIDAGAVTWGHADVGVSGVVSADNSLVGSSTQDAIGRYGIHALPSGDYFVASTYWDNSFGVDAGAVTWGDGDVGVSGPITEHNSLIGSATNDRFGRYYPVAVGNGGYLMACPECDVEGRVDSGAVVWMDSTRRMTGRVSRSNALIGTHAGDRVGTWAIALSNGNYVVGSPDWDNDTLVDVGAATWANGHDGLRGTVSINNSLVGATRGDQVGFGITALRNGHYVVVSQYWDSASVADVGAVTWGNGDKGRIGVVAAGNSLIGSSHQDYVGRYGIEPLQNGNYVVVSPQWNNGSVADVGAATWMYGRKTRAAVVSSANSLVGTKAFDMASTFVVALRNGNYAVVSSEWDNGGIQDAGAVTWGDGRSGVSGTISMANSLVGSSSEDIIGLGRESLGFSRNVTALANGHFVVGSPEWNNAGIEDAGAVTWVDGTRPSAGPINPSNSLVGTTSNESIGGWRILALDNGGFIYFNPYWDDGSLVNVGAVTLSSGTSPLVGTVSPANSLIGLRAGDSLGNSGVTLLGGGAFALSSPYWDNGDLADAGAITWINSSDGLPATISTSNSLIGTTPGDWIGAGDITVTPDGDYLILSTGMNNGSIPAAGAVSFIRGGVPPTGALPLTETVRGAAAGLGYRLTMSYHAARRQLVVGRDSENIVSVLTLPPQSAPAPNTSVRQRSGKTYGSLR